jgi:hypothetical protein
MSRKSERAERKLKEWGECPTQIEITFDDDDWLIEAAKELRLAKERDSKRYRSVETVTLPGDEQGRSAAPRNPGTT